MTSHDITWHHMTLYNVAWHRMISHDIALHATPRHVALRHAASRRSKATRPAPHHIASHIANQGKQVHTEKHCLVICNHETLHLSWAYVFALQQRGIFNQNTCHFFQTHILVSESRHAPHRAASRRVASHRVVSSRIASHRIALKAAARATPPGMFESSESASPWDCL